MAPYRLKNGRLPKDQLAPQRPVDEVVRVLGYANAAYAPTILKIAGCNIKLVRQVFKPPALMRHNWRIAAPTSTNPRRIPAAKPTPTRRGLTGEAPRVCGIAVVPGNSDIGARRRRRRKEHHAEPTEDQPLSTQRILGVHSPRKPFKLRNAPFGRAAVLGQPATLESKATAIVATQALGPLDVQCVELACAVCMDARRTHVLLPCGHLSCYESCVRACVVVGQPCFTCNVVVQSVQAFKLDNEVSQPFGFLDCSTEKSSIIMADASSSRAPTSIADVATQARSSKDGHIVGLSCVVCRDSQRTCFSVPCGHCSCCESCQGDWVVVGEPCFKCGMIVKSTHVFCH